MLLSEGQTYNNSPKRSLRKLKIARAKHQTTCCIYGSCLPLYCALCSKLPKTQASSRVNAQLFLFLHVPVFPSIPSIVTHDRVRESKLDMPLSALKKWSSRWPRIPPIHPSLAATRPVARPPSVGE